MHIERFAATDRLSKVLKADGHVYVSGLTARDKSADVAAQTTDVLAQIDAYLAMAGSDKTRLLKVNIWLAEIADFAEMNRAWDAWVPAGAPPSRATVESRLAGNGNLVEMMAEALA
ncbi:RidA family protein [Nitratireductor sp. CAU 1489]|uniref:RidA family protein n=1 Tax=Nitratireductor arenosus TaxID=2682096 RepID=A0A844QEC3_9HYPH|nr:RidA family protein [Nitratireductor arenosus]MVA96974.1 RidA family protein [Nitratireductor arenosus]